MAATILQDPSRLTGEAVEIAGDELTGRQIAEAIGAYLHKRARFEALSLDAFAHDADRTAMFTWFGAPPSYRADFSATKALAPQALTFADWLARNS